MMPLFFAAGHIHYAQYHGGRTMLLLKFCFNGIVTPFWTVSYHVLTVGCTVLTSCGQVLTVFSL